MTYLDTVIWHATAATCRMFSAYCQHVDDSEYDAFVTEMEHCRPVMFRVDRPGLAWRRWGK